MNTLTVILPDGQLLCDIVPQIHDLRNYGRKETDRKEGEETFPRSPIDFVDDDFSSENEADDKPKHASESEHYRNGSCGSEFSVIPWSMWDFLSSDC
jgi:hypothetical protein